MMAPFETDRSSNRFPRLLWCILALSLILNLWGIWFGLPEIWHPDEIMRRAAKMARNFSVNPHAFQYGSMHYLLQLVVMVPTYLLTEIASASYDTQKTLVGLAARMLSALMGTGCVALTYLLARTLFDSTTAILAALLFALSIALVTLSHFATVDVPMLFWMAAAWLASARIMVGGGGRYYLLAGVLVGFAAATKYVGGTAALALVVAHALRSGGRPVKPLFLGAAAAILAFLIMNPALFFASCEVIEGFIRDNAYNSTFGKGPDTTHVTVLTRALLMSMGWPVASISAVAVVYGAARCLLVRNELRPLIFVFAALLAFGAVAGSISYATTRHILPMVPLLMILVGKMVADMITAEHRYRLIWRWVGGTAFAGLVLISSLQAISAGLQFTFDSRALATNWINQNVPTGSTIENSHYGPYISEERYQVEDRPPFGKMREDVVKMTDAGIYRLLHPVYLQYKSLAEDIGVCPVRDRHYVGWYERALVQSEENLVGFDPTMEGLKARAPDLLVVSSFWYGNFRDDPTGPDGAFFAELFKHEHFELVEEFRYQFIPWLDPSVEFINPTIRIYRPVTASVHRVGATG